MDGKRFYYLGVKMKLIKQHQNFLAILAIVILTLVTWHKVYYQSFMGEGYDYFDETFFSGSQGALITLLSFDTLARLTFDILPRFFADNLQLYMLWMLVIVSLVNVFYYLLVYTLTEKRIIALIASIFFIVNHVTSYEMLAFGFYQFFVQRVVNFIFIFPSFLLLVKFLKEKAGKFSYLISIFLYLLAVLGGQFSIFFLSMFVFYTLAFWFEKKRNWRSFLAKFSLTLPFVLGTLILLWLDKHYGSPLISEKPFFDFIFHYETLIEDIAYQLPWMLFPLPILELFTEPQVRVNMIALSVPVVVFYLIIVYYWYRRQTAFRAFILSTPAFILSTLFLNVYTRASQIYQIYHNGSRYLYVPWIGVSIFFAIILYSFFYPAPEGYGAGKRKSLGKLLLLGLMGWWIFFNLNLIWTNMDEKQKEHIASKRILRYVKEKSSQYPENAFVVLPDVIGSQGADFCKKFYGRGSMRFAPIFVEWEKQLDEDFDLERLFILDYDYERELVVER